MEEVLEKKIQYLEDENKQLEDLIKELVNNHQDIYFDKVKTQNIFDLQYKIQSLELKNKDINKAYDNLKYYYPVNFRKIPMMFKLKLKSIYWDIDDIHNKYEFRFTYDDSNLNKEEKQKFLLEFITNINEEEYNVKLINEIGSFTKYKDCCKYYNNWRKIIYCDIKEGDIKTGDIKKNNLDTDYLIKIYT
jgi:hypothetical protein